MTEIHTKSDKAYQKLVEDVAGACVALMSGRCQNDDGSRMSDFEIHRFFQFACSYEEEFAEGMSPEQVAEAQLEAMT